MSSTGFDLANQLAILQVGRLPTWTQQSAINRSANLLRRRVAAPARLFVARPTFTPPTNCTM